MDFTIIPPHPLLDTIALSVVLHGVPTILTALGVLAAMLVVRPQAPHLPLSFGVHAAVTLAALWYAPRLLMLAVQISKCVLAARVMGLSHRLSYGSAIAVGMQTVSKASTILMLHVPIRSAVHMTDSFLENLVFGAAYQLQIMRLRTPLQKGVMFALDLLSFSVLVHMLMCEFMEVPAVEKQEIQLENSYRVKAPDTELLLNVAIALAATATSGSSLPALFPSESGLRYSAHVTTALGAALANLATFIRFWAEKKSMPLWSVVAAVYSMRALPAAFLGQISVEHEKEARSLVRYGNTKRSLSFPDDAFPLKCVVDYVGETSMAFQMVQVVPSPGPKSMLESVDVLVLVNGIEWNTHSYNEEYVVIIGLTPGHIYDIEIYIVSRSAEEEENKKNEPEAPVHREALVAQYILQTKGGNTSSNTQGARKTIETPLETLKKSVTTTQALVNRERLKLKKTRKENAKVVLELSKEIENVLKRVKEADKLDEKLWRRVGSLKTETKALEGEIQVAKKDAEAVHKERIRVQEEYEVKKKQYLKRKAELEKEMGIHRGGMESAESKLVSLKHELASWESKKEKVKARADKYREECAKAEESQKAKVEELFEKIHGNRQARHSKRMAILAEFQMEIEKVEAAAQELERRLLEIGQ